MRQIAYMIDLDGTMYHGTRPSESAIVWIDSLLEKKIPFLFLTNNASRTPKQNQEHMLRLGFHGIEPHHFFTSAMAAARYMARTSEKRRAYMVGEQGLQWALEDAGFHIVSEEADYVFIGLDKGGNYAAYSAALRECLRGAVLVGTNNDRRILLEDGAYLGNGSIVAMMEYASCKEAIKIGKPHAPIIEEALRFMQRSKENCILVGDNLETDILCGINNGVETILVLGGIHGIQDCDTLQIYPTYIIRSLADISVKIK